MRLTRRGTLLAFASLLGVTSALLATQVLLKARPVTSGDIAAMQFAPYDAQRVVYHVTEGEWFFERKFKNILHIAGNHVGAVAPGQLDLRIVLQGGGLDLLMKAKTDAQLARDVDKLRRAGVTFAICRNTLVLRGIDPDTELYGVRRGDIVASGVAETASLAAKGHVYMKF